MTYMCQAVCWVVGIQRLGVIPDPKDAPSHGTTDMNKEFQS